MNNAIPLAFCLLLAPALQELDDAQRRALETLVAPHADADAPGGILAVLWEGVPCFVRPFGLANVERRVPVDSGTVFYLASAAKAITAECVLTAAAEGELMLEDALGKHVPLVPPAFAPVPLAELLRHTGGIPDIYDLAIGLDLGRECLASNEAALAVLARLPQLDFEPGARCVYSNSGYLYLAEAVRHATGQPFAAFARARIFAPLGMDSTRFTGEPELEPLPRAQSYHEQDGRWVPFELVTHLVGPGGLWTSLDDLVRHERSAAAAAAPAGRAAARFAVTQASSAGQHPLLGRYDLGRMASEELGLASVRTAGEAFGFQAELLRLPDFGLTVIVLANADRGTDGLCEAVAELLLHDEVQAARAAARSTPASIDLALLGRFWREEATGLPWMLDLQPGAARVIALGDWRIELEPAAGGRLVGQRTRVPVELRFEPPDGPAEHMLVLCAGRELARCAPHSPSEQSDLAELAGTYELPTLGVTLEFRAVERGLELVQRRPLAPAYLLPPFLALGGDFLLCDAGAALQFRRGADGKVTGARLDVNRARGLELVRRR
jgi:CubicO group peptidase (beta-lactamase class C family)